jgi:hypothetical protein
MDLDSSVLLQLAQLMEGGASARKKLEAGLRLLAKWRSVLIQNTVLQEHGAVIQGGPFAGMKFVSRSAEGCHVPKLLGCYETELHRHLVAASKRDYEALINIGAAEGYYAVGLGLLMKQPKIYAFERNPAAREICRAVAELNHVSDRLEIHGEFRGEDFAAFDGKRTLVICDIEGGERLLIDPDRYPALLGMDLIVELHEEFDPAVGAIIGERFRSTHQIEFVANAVTGMELPALFSKLGHLDQLLALWEWRSGPTPWVVMRASRAR